MKKAVSGVTKMSDSGKGGFGYSNTGPGRGAGATGLTGAGVLSMQFLGAAKAKETRAGLDWMQAKRPELNWSNSNFKEVYYWYYDTQARFHAGGQTWKSWNGTFSPRLVEAQTIEEGAGIDGKDIGYWDVTTPTGHGYRIMTTTLCTLMLEVY